MFMYNSGGSVSIRFIQPEDWSIVRDIVLEIHTDAPYAIGGSLGEEEARTTQEWQQYARKLADTTQACGYLAEDTHGVCGFVVGDSTYPQLPPGMIAVLRLWIAPRKRGTGLGRRLMDAVTGWAQEWGANQIGLGVKETNPNALKFYLHLGYLDTGVRMQMPNDPTNVILMVRGLKPEQPS